jgi:hypothetical protein
MNETQLSQTERISNRQFTNGYLTELAEILDAVTCDLGSEVGWPRFELGRLNVTEMAERRLDLDDIVEGLVTHGFGRWGRLSQRELEANCQALQEGGRLLSRHRGAKGSVFWIGTDWDRRRTTVFMPVEH